MLINLIEKANEEQIKEFIKCYIKELKERNKDEYNKAIMKLYEMINGYHFDENMLSFALLDMVNEDGSIGGHWNLNDTNDVANRYNVQFDHFNQYDWNYVMNMMYSDYYGVVNNDVKTYVELAKRFLNDKDAPKGKALKYYWTMHQ